MGVLRKGVDRLEDRTRRNRMKRKGQKKRRPEKSGKDKPSIKLTIPSRRGRRKK
jgi:hypothetical protein